MEDIENSVRFILQKAGKELSLDEFRKTLLIGRQRRLGLIHMHYQDVLYTPLGRASFQTERLKITLPDTLVFLKNIGILKLEKGIVQPLPLAYKLGSTLQTNEARLSLIEALINSKYPAYWCILLLLSTQGRVRIPKGLSGRHKSLRKTLLEQGVLTDVASFYAMRDLFYELDVVNWYVDLEGDEYVYPTIVIANSGACCREYEYSLPVGTVTLLYQKKISMDLFAGVLVDSYMKLTKGHFDSEADLMSVRDEVCKALAIGDQRFNELLLTLRQNSKDRTGIRLSFGQVYGKKRNYALKIMTLPRISENRLALFIRITRRDLV